MLIKELAKRTGLTIHTIRYYENIGLIEGLNNEKVTSNNYKHYDEGIVEKLEIIIEAKTVGFTLAEIRKLIESWYGENSSRDEQIEMFNSKILEIESKIKQLRQIKKRLESVIKELKNEKC